MKRVMGLTPALRRGPSEARPVALERVVGHQSVCLGHTVAVDRHSLRAFRSIAVFVIAA